MTGADPDCFACHGRLGLHAVHMAEACPWCWPVECSTCDGHGEILIGPRYCPCPDCEDKP